MLNPALVLEDEDENAEKDFGDEQDDEEPWVKWQQECVLTKGSNASGETWKLAGRKEVIRYLCLFPATDS